MQPKTRDNLIYLGVGLCVAGLLTADFFYADSRGREMWMPSRFAFRTVFYTSVLGFFVARETRKVKATLVQVATCVLFAIILHLGVAFAFRQVFSDRFSASLWVLATLELFVITQLTVYVVRHLQPKSHRG